MNEHEYLLGNILGLKVAVGALAFRYVANTPDPKSEIQALNDIAHRLLALEKLMSTDPVKADRVRAAAEQVLDDTIGNITWKEG